MTKSEMKQAKQELQESIVARLVLPDLGEWKNRWKDWMDEFISTTTLYSADDKYSRYTGKQKLTATNLQEMIDSHWESILEWASPMNWWDGGHWLTCQDYLIAEAEEAFEKFVYENNKALFAEQDCHNLEDAMEFFSGLFWELYRSYVYEVLNDYTDEDFIKAYITE